MKRFKYLFLGIFLLLYYGLPFCKEVLDHEINYSAIASYVAKGLYEDSLTVSTTKLQVKDFVLEGDVLYIFPLNQEVKLPFGVMIASLKNDQMDVVDTQYRYSIGHYEKKCVRLYEYKKEEAVLATTGDFYTITGTDLNRIIARLEIDYAQV